MTPPWQDAPAYVAESGFSGTVHLMQGHSPARSALSACGLWRIPDEGRVRLGRLGEVGCGRCKRTAPFYAARIVP